MIRTKLNQAQLKQAHTNQGTIIWRTVTCLLICATLATASETLTSSVTYQGELSDDGQPLNGTTDLMFTLFDAEIGGTAQSATIAADDVLVVDGVFNVELDFGTNAFNSQTRWLEIDVRDGAECCASPYTTMTPRQKLTAAPTSWYAMRPWIENNDSYYIWPTEDFGEPQSGVGIAITAPEARLHVRKSPFSPSEPALRLDDAFSRSQLRIDTPESAGRAELQAWNGETNSAGPLILNPGGGNVGVGTSNPLSALEVNGNIQADYLLAGTDIPNSGIFINNEQVDTFSGSLKLQSIYGTPVTTGGDLTVGEDLTVGGELKPTQYPLTIPVGGGSASLRLNTNSLNTVALSMKTFEQDWWVGQNRVTPTNEFWNEFFIRNESSGVDKIRIERGGVASNIHLNGTVQASQGITTNEINATTANINALDAQLINTPSLDVDGQVTANHVDTQTIQVGHASISGTLTVASGVSVGHNLAVTNNLTVNGNIISDELRFHNDGKVEIGPPGVLTYPSGKLYVRGGGRVVMDDGGGCIVLNEAGSGINAGFTTNNGVLRLWANGGLGVTLEEDHLGNHVLGTDILLLKGGSDIAEPFDINGNIPTKPGMVVSIDPNNPGELRVASSAYDPTVAGIISGAGGVNPGLMLQQEGTIADGEHPVALTGRVYAYVDADANGAVTPGDMLTTSDTPGHAMKATDRDLAFGSIIGKAMTELKSGKGLVLVLVNLQ